MSDLSRVAVSGTEGARVYPAGLAVVPRPNTPSDPDVAVNGTEAAKGGQGNQDI
jgi:hypothetical protein